MASFVKKVFKGKTEAELKDLQKKYNIKFEESNAGAYDVYDKNFAGVLNLQYQVNPKSLVHFPNNIDGFTIPILSEEESKELIKLTESIQYGPCGYPKNYRSNSRIIINDPNLAKLLYKRIKQIAPQSMEKHSWQNDKVEKWDICGLNERFRYCRYVKGQHFGSHCDAKFTRKSDEMSFYTVNIYLNEYAKEFTGGRTIFYEFIEKGGKQSYYDVKPTPGLALIFNHTTQSYLHGGERLESGVKYIMRTDIMYRRYNPNKVITKKEQLKKEHEKEIEKEKALKEIQAKQEEAGLSPASQVSAAASPALAVNDDNNNNDNETKNEDVDITVTSNENENGNENNNENTTVTNEETIVASVGGDTDLVNNSNENGNDGPNSMEIDNAGNIEDTMNANNDNNNDNDDNNDSNVDNVGNDDEVNNGNIADSNNDNYNNNNNDDAMNAPTDVTLDSMAIDTNNNYNEADIDAPIDTGMGSPVDSPSDAPTSG